MGGLLDTADAQRASLASKAWRELLLPMLLRKLHCALAEVVDPRGRVTRSPAGRWVTSDRLRQLLQLAPPGLQLQLILDGRRLPSDGQVDAVLSALGQQHSSGQLRLQLLLKHEGDSISAKSSSRAAAVLQRIIRALAAAGEQRISSLDIVAGPTREGDLGAVCACLAQLRGLQHLGCSGAGLFQHHLVQLGALTSLTSLTSLALDCQARIEIESTLEVPEYLDPLAQLSQLQSLTVLARWHTGVFGIHGDKLPAWPHLRHLHLELGSRDLNLLLSAEQCAQLQSLHVPVFHAAPGVSGAAWRVRPCVAGSGRCRPALQAPAGRTGFPARRRRLAQHAADACGAAAQVTSLEQLTSLTTTHLAPSPPLDVQLPALRRLAVRKDQRQRPLATMSLHEAMGLAQRASAELLVGG
jgi:hypothetical protein